MSSLDRTEEVLNLLEQVVATLEGKRAAEGAQQMAQLAVVCEQAKADRVEWKPERVARARELEQRCATAMQRLQAHLHSELERTGTSRHALGVYARNGGQRRVR